MYNEEVKTSQEVDFYKFIKNIFSRYRCNSTKKMQEMYVVTIHDTDNHWRFVDLFSTKEKALEFIEQRRFEMLKDDPTIFRKNICGNVKYTIETRPVDNFENKHFGRPVYHILYDMNWKPFTEWQKQNARDPLQISLEIDELQKKHDQEVQLKGPSHFECMDIRFKISSLKEDLDEAIKVHKTITT